jgi:hypothetical protein
MKYILIFISRLICLFKGHDFVGPKGQIFFQYTINEPKLEYKIDICSRCGHIDNSVTIYNTSDKWNSYNGQ